MPHASSAHAGRSRSRLIRARRILAGAALLAVAILLWGTWPRHADLRGFNPTAAARLETRMWRNYYEQRRVALVVDLYRLARTQYGFSPWDSLRIAWHAGRAARLFQPTRNRDTATAALPALKAYFRVIASGTASSFNVNQAAREELDWWQRRREGQTWEEYAPAVARVTALIYAVPEDRVMESARLRCAMMAERDRHHDSPLTDAGWAEIEAGLVQSWKALGRAVK